MEKEKGTLHLLNQSDLDSIYEEIKLTHAALQKAVERLHKWEPIFDFPNIQKSPSFENHNKIQE